ncbi:MAG: DUF1549 and DUF1553 domain-containing protein, partial [Pirellulaceae bacterium]
ESEVYRRMVTEDPDERMPPADEKPLTSAEIEKLKQWIAAGAPWSEHWAFTPLKRPSVPQPAQSTWVRNDIDRFVLARLEAEKMSPAAEADRYTLIKRLYYDLLGLPPTIEEVDAFVKDASEEAYARLVDRLLRSPHFGERWGRHWLDLAHFADTDGFEKDRARPDAHVWRDWVIDAVNADMPFDQFTIEQLAGDLLPGATARQRLATGFLRQTLTNEEGGVDQEEFRIAACFDRTETVGTVWLGLTIGCIRCHEHKYDPMPHADYYKLFAFFNNAEEVTSRVPVEATELEQLEAELRPLETALQRRYAELAVLSRAWETEQHQRIMAQREGTLREEVVEIKAVESAVDPATIFEVKGDQVHVVSSAAEAKSADPGNGRDTYVVDVRLPATRLTGLKLYALPDDQLPKHGPGLSTTGNFVLSRLELLVVRPDGTSEPLPLHRAKADFTQPGFSAESVLAADTAGDKPSGWAIGDRTGKEHWLQVRLLEPLVLPEGGQLRVVLSQQHGERHVLGRFRLAALVGNERGLYLPDEAIANALEMYPEKRVASTQQQLFNYYVTDVARDPQALELRERIESLYRRHRARLMDVRTIGSPRLARETRIFHRGDFLSPTDPIQPGVPAVLASYRARGEHGDRLDLAQWLVARENFLTPRVAVNHVWQHLFGAGIVRTPNDFGARGEPPTHPELLDWLALQFREDLAWSRKELIRLIVSSAAYRQSSRFRPELEARDSRNLLLFRQNRFRVESEIVRDLNLAVGGLLSAKVGGPSVYPPMPEDLAKLSYANNFTWKNSEGEDRYRRGMYTFFKRTIPHPNLMTFDSPDANVACVARTVSNTPLQSLTLLNNEAHVEAAQALARRLLAAVPAKSVGGETGPDQDRLRMTTAVRLCVARPPTEGEVQTLTRVLDTSRTYYGQHETEAKQFVGREVPQDVPTAELAAWVSVARVVLNLDEFLTRV